VRFHFLEKQSQFETEFIWRKQVMHIDEIREKVADKLSSAEEMMSWIDLLQDTSPGHYGIEDVDVDVSAKDIWVDVPKREFSFKNASISFSARLGASSDEHGYDDNFTKTVTGQGKFDFSDGSKDVTLMELSINENIELYEEE